MIQQAGATVLGIDISDTAVTKARARFPRLEFKVDSVTDIAAYPDFDAILFAEIT